MRWFVRPWKTAWCVSLMLAAWYFYDGYAALIVVLATVDYDPK